MILPGVHCYRSQQAAIAAIRDYKVSLLRNAIGRGTSSRDQSCACDAFIYQPKSPTKPPLLLLGGMGPYAGASIFEYACNRFNDDRVVMLYQACSTRDRTEVIRHVMDSGSQDAAVALADQVVAALMRAVGLLYSEVLNQTPSGNVPNQIDCVMSCNTVHYFLPLIRQRIEQGENSVLRRLQFASIIEAAVSQLRPGLPVVLTATTGTLLCGIYARALRRAKVPLILPSTDAQDALMRAIYQGMKAFNPAVARAAGNEFFGRLLPEARQVDTIVAACSEVPLLFQAIAPQMRPELAQLFHSKHMIDPVVSVIDQLHIGGVSTGGVGQASAARCGG